MPATLDEALDFWIDKDREPRVIQLKRFKKWCPNHKERLNQVSGKLTNPDKSEIVISGFDELLKYGIEFDETFYQLKVFTADIG